MWTLYSCLFVWTLLLTSACKSKSIADVKRPSVKGVTHFRNIIQTAQIGDSMRLEVERDGNTLIKHYIDLYGTKGDNFDNSYNATCVYTRRNVDSIVLIKDKKTQIKAELMETYTTEFSGGKNLYWVTSDGDTVLHRHWMGYIR